MLQLVGVSKCYPGVQALQDVDFDLLAGEVHVLFGENGAGKSTLIGILAGLRPPTSGQIRLHGKDIGALTPFTARQLGISSVFQEFSLIPSLSVLDNLFLGREERRFGLLDRRGMARRATTLFESLQFDLPIHAVVSTLTRARRQMVEIAKALLSDNASILILDEPTASLSDHEADKLMEAVFRVKQKGVGVIYVSHRLREIRALADRVTVLRNGRKVGTITGTEASEDVLVEMMTGRRVEALFPRIDTLPGDVRLDVQQLSLAGDAVRGLSLQVRAGEVLGLAGLVGCGKSEVGRALFGLERIVAGLMNVDGRPVRPSSPRQMLAERVCYFPSDRAAEGLALNRSVLENASMACLDQPDFASRGFVRTGNERLRVFGAMKQLGLSPLALDIAVASLSGGNKQKVMLGRGLLRDIDVYIFDEPTVGIDVGAKVEIYEFIASLARRGAAVLLISSELPEVLNLSHRVVVMHEGRAVCELEGDMKTNANVLEGFFGRAPVEPQSRIAVAA